MKIHIDLPWGGTFELERGKMAPETKARLFWLLVILIGCKSVLAFFGMVT